MAKRKKINELAASRKSQTRYVKSLSHLLRVVNYRNGLLQKKLEQFNQQPCNPLDDATLPEIEELRESVGQLYVSFTLIKQDIDWIRKLQDLIDHDSELKLSDEDLSAGHSAE